MIFQFFFALRIIHSSPEHINMKETISNFFQLALPLIFALSGVQAGAQCGGDFSELRLEIDPDQYFNEVSWVISSPDGSPIYGTGFCTSSQLANYTYCIPTGECAIFHILDSYGDGIAPDGFYRLYLNGEQIYEDIGGYYGSGDQVEIGCPPGTSCNTALAVTEGEHTTLPGGGESWYAFTPQQNGAYVLSTCYPTNACPTKIWVYSQCDNIYVVENNLGTLFYSESGCDTLENLAKATLYLAGNQTYYLRIGYANDAVCDSAAITFNLYYEGPVTGCTDSTACNYNPLAEISSDCIYPGDPDCPNAPDLLMREDDLRNTISLVYYDNDDVCNVEEGCFRGFGSRAVLSFLTHIQNIGEEDYYIGPTPATPETPSDQFVWDPCHHHWHYRGYAEYIVFDENNNQMPLGSKNGFCVIDLECDNGGDGKYHCNNMGISAGCGDYYDQGLPCQWVDITNIPPGNYTLVVRVNWDQSPDKVGRIEKTYANNWAQACFTLQYNNSGTPDVEFNIGDCPVVVDCAGEPAGNARLDCEGVCNGPRLMGDWNVDTLRNAGDVTAYMQTAAAGNGVATNCNDLYDDDLIDVYDAALLQECMLHGNDPQYWVYRFPCQFPTGLISPEDVVTLTLGALDTVGHTIDVEITNPYSKILGYEFDLSGIGQITQVENINAAWQGDLIANGRRVVGLSTNEIPTGKNINATSLVRIHYDQLTDSVVCIAAIQAVVNESYQRSTALLGEPHCKSVIVSGIDEQTLYTQRAVVIPNPTSGDANLFLLDASSGPYTVILSDQHGKIVHTQTNLTDSRYTFKRQNHAAGIYYFQIVGQTGVASGRFVWK
jgi:hypothetical protein